MLTITIVSIMIGIILLMWFESYGFQFSYGTQKRIIHLLVFNVLCGRIAPSHWHLKEFRWIWFIGNVLFTTGPMSEIP